MFEKYIQILLLYLTADIGIESRPYTDERYVTSTQHTKDDLIETIMNTTQIINIPINPDSDTLTIADDLDDAEIELTLDKSSDNTAMNREAVERILQAEQERDVKFLKKTNIDDAKVLGMARKDVENVLRNQMNITSSLMQDVLDAETDRDKTLTNIYVSADNFNENPKFQHLTSKIGSNKTQKRVITVSDINLDDYVELVEVIRPTVDLNNSAYKTFANETGFYVESDPADSFLSMFAGFSDVQTLFLACFATLLPLMIVLVFILLMRCVLKRWCPKCCRSSDNISSVYQSSQRSESDKEDYDNEVKSSTSLVMNNGTKMNGICGTYGIETINNGCGIQPSSTNGSIITMTLKNNHLIVETEERDDIEKDTKETKMKYTPNNNGIFIVKVQQSSHYRQSNDSPGYESIPTNQQALVHREDDKSNQVEAEPTRAHSNTGLSISDQSISSNDDNPNYCYTNQIGYEEGPFGYNVYSGYDVANETVTRDDSKEPLISKTPIDPDKPVITAAIFKQDSILANDLSMASVPYCMEGSSDGPLLSDKQAREVSLQKIHDEKDKIKDDLPGRIEIQQPVKTESIPVLFEFDNEVHMNDIKQNNDVESIEDTEKQSLPAISSELCDSILETATIILENSSKFEVAYDDLSPVSQRVPTITVTEEKENDDDRTDLEDDENR